VLFAGMPMNKFTIASAQIALFFFLFLLSFHANAMVGVDTMFANFGKSAIRIIKLVVFAGIIIGIFISCVGVVKLKEYSESGGRTTFKTPLMLIFVGVMLVALPGTINMATETMSLGANTGTAVFSIGKASSMPPGMDAAIKGVLLFIKMVGHIAIVRGFFILKRLGEGQQGEMGRALTHILGGALAVNINKTVEILANTVGMPL